MSTTITNAGYNYWPNMQGYANNTQSSATNNLNSIYGMTNNNQNYMNDPYFMAAFQSPNANAEIYAQQAQQTGAQQPIATQPTGQVPTVPSAADKIAFQGKQNAPEPEKKNNAANWIVGLASVAGLIFCGYKCHGKGVGEGTFTKIWDGAKKYWDDGITWLGKHKFNKQGENKTNPTKPIMNTKPIGGIVGTPKGVEEAINPKKLTQEEILQKIITEHKAKSTSRPRRPNGQFVSIREVAIDNMIKEDYLTPKSYNFGIQH